MSDCNVYVIGPASGPQKIGLTHNLPDRLKHLQIGHPQELQIHTSTAAARMDAYSLEHIAHALLAPWRLKGEWFDVSPAVATAAVERAARDVGRGQQPPSPAKVANGLFWMRHLGGYSADRLQAARAYAELVEFVELGAQSYSAVNGETRSHRMVADAKARLMRLDEGMGEIAAALLRKVACRQELPSGRELPALNAALDFVLNELDHAK